MSVHEQFADDLALYALGTLQREERLAVDKHLADCPDCRHELEQLRGDLALLAFSAAGPEPPPRSRKRLMAAIANERSPAVAPSRKRANWWRSFEWAAAAAAIAIIVLLLRQNGDLRQRVAGMEANSAGQQRQLIQAKDLISSLTSADAVRFTLVAGNKPPQPQGKAIYVRNSSTLVFLASNMPALSAGKTYELWLIPTSGAPVPAGLFKPDRQGGAAVIKPSLPAGLEAKTFAITVEPEAGSPAPTSAVIMVGAPG